MVTKRRMPLRITTVLFALLTCNANAENIEKSDIVGSYKHLIILENNTFSVISLGAILRGHWKLKGNIVTFKTHKEQLFRLYGRKLLETEKPNQIRFGGFTNRYVSIGINPTDKRQKVAQRLLKGDSCRADGGYYFHSQTQAINLISLAQKEDAVPLEYEHTVYDFNIPNEYNDLVAYMPSPINVNSQTFTARFENDRLYDQPDQNLGSLLGTKKGVQRSPLKEIEDDELSMIRNYANDGLYPSVLKYKNTHYRNSELSDELYPFEKNPTVDNTQDFIEIVPTITSAIINQDEKHLIDLECKEND